MTQLMRLTSAETSELHRSSSTRIGSDRVAIEVHDGHDPRTFDATIDLQGFQASPDAIVVLEAACAGSNTIRRYAWGTIGQLLPPEDRALSDLHGGNVFFTLNVIDRSERFGRILGLAENIRPLKAGPKTATGRRVILPVEKANLGDELWKLDFRSEDVLLLVNEKIPGLSERVRFDPAIYTLIYPAIIRDILRRALDEQPDDEEDSERWPTLWLQFGRRLLLPEVREPPVSDDDEEREERVAEVVAAFCREHDLTKKFTQAAGHNLPKLDDRRAERQRIGESPPRSEIANGSPPPGLAMSRKKRSTSSRLDLPEAFAPTTNMRFRREMSTSRKLRQFLRLSRETNTFTANLINTGPSLLPPLTLPRPTCQFCLDLRRPLSLRASELVDRVREARSLCRDSRIREGHGEKRRPETVAGRCKTSLDTTEPLVTRSNRSSIAMALRLVADRKQSVHDDGATIASGGASLRTGLLRVWSGDRQVDGDLGDFARETYVRR